MTPRRSGFALELYDKQPEKWLVLKQRAAKARFLLADSVEIYIEHLYA